MPSEDPQLQDDPAQDQEPTESFSGDEGEDPNPMPTTVDEADVSSLDVVLTLTEEQEKEIVHYLEDNLPRMKCTVEEEQTIQTYFAMYEMAARNRNFPYENAPSVASSDMHDKLNELLDQDETAFLQQKVTFAIDREDTSMDEEDASRVERTVHKKYFKPVLAKDLRLILFEARFLGASIVSVREEYDLRPTRKKVIIKTQQDLEAEQQNLTTKQQNEAKDKITKGDMFFSEKDVLEVVNVGPVVNRINRTKFLYPRNETNWKKWQIVSEVEFYTKSSLREMAEMGELESAKVEKCIEARKSAYARKIDEEKKSGVTEEVKPHILDVSWTSDLKNIKEMGDSYEDEFAIYRTTMLYNTPTKVDKSGKLRTWIEILYCPAGNCILGAVFCQDGFPYRTIQTRTVPYKAFGPGVAQERFNANALSSDLLSYFLASLEQEIGSPLMIRKSSSLWATNFRAYPASAVYTEDPQKDAMFLPFPEKSRLAVEGVKTILGSSPDANQGAGYASGKRQELLDQDKQMKAKARLLAIAMDFDDVFNAAWKILCRISKFNTPEKAYIPWVVDDEPKGKKLYVTSDEMDPDMQWSCTVAAISMSPDARLQHALMQKEIMHDKVPVSVNSPRLTIGWMNWLANFYDNMDEKARQDLLPTEQDFQQMQAQQGAMGGQPSGASPSQPHGAPQQNGAKPPVPALVAQSQNTPFRNPAARQ